MLKHGDVVVEGRWDTELSIKVYQGNKRLYNGDIFDAGYCMNHCEGCDPEDRNSANSTLYIDGNHISAKCSVGKSIYGHCVDTYIGYGSCGEYKIRRITNTDLPIVGTIACIEIRYVVYNSRLVFVPYNNKYTYRFRMDPSPSGCGHGGANCNHGHTGKGLLVGAYKYHWDEQVTSYEDDTTPIYFTHKHSKSIYSESGLYNFDWPCEYRRRQRRAWKRNKIRHQWMKNHPDKTTHRIGTDYITETSSDDTDMAA